MQTANLIAYALVAAVAAACAVTDVRSGKVLNRVTYPAMVFGLVFWAVAGGLIAGSLGGAGRGALWALGGWAAGAIPLGLIALGRAGIGMGDAKLTAAIGALSASWQMVLDSVVYALVVCLLWCVWIMVRQRIVKRTLGRLFGAAMMAGARAKVEFPDDSPRVPIGAAIAVGASVAGIEHLLGGELPWSWLTS